MYTSQTRFSAPFALAVASALLVCPLAATAQSNTAYGTSASAQNGGSFNCAFGNSALFSNTGGSSNVAIGADALYFNTTGGGNIANGYGALFYNTTGNSNVAIGDSALYYNTTGRFNVAIGDSALGNNLTTGNYNTATGANALGNNTGGNNNVANGVYALQANTTGVNNTANGFAALYSSTGSTNIGLGYGAGYNVTTGSNNIELGNYGYPDDNAVLRIGTNNIQTSTYIAGISGVTATGGVAVYIKSNGQLGTITSSRRFKKDIKDMGSVSSKLMQLRPVTFRYKKAEDNGAHPLQYGLIAEEVAKVYPDLVQYDKQGKPFTIYYHLLTPLILSELQKAHHQNVALKSAVTGLVAAHSADKAQIAALKTQMTAMATAHDTEIASLKQSLAKLAAYVEASQNKAPVQKAAFIQH